MEYLRKNHDNLAIILMIVMMVFQNSLFKLLAGIIPAFDVSYNPPWLCALYVLIIVAVYGLVLVPRVVGKTGIRGICSQYKGLICELAILLLAIVSVDAVTLIRGQLRITNIFTHNLDYFYAFLALPIVILLAEGEWKIESMVRTMVILTVVSGIMRFAVSYYFGVTGIEIQCISRESAIEGWMRNGRLRMVAPCMSMLLMPILVYFCVKAETVLWRLFYGAGFVFNVFYVYYVWQSRACIIYTLASLGVMLMFWPMSKKLTRIKWGAAGLCVIGFFMFGGMQILIDQFSTDESSKYFMENRGHYNVYKCFIEKYLRSPIFGDGLTETLAEWFGDRALWLTDGGLLYSIVPMGILMIVFFVFVLCRGISIYVKTYRQNDMAILALAIIALVFACGVSIDFFMTGICFSVPFYLAIVEYVAVRYRSGDR